MSDSYHPENIHPNGPSNLDPETLKLEIANNKYAVAFSSGYVALLGTLAIINIIPNFTEAISQSDAFNIAQYGLITTIFGICSGLSLANIRAYGTKLKQARYNQRLIGIAEANGMDYGPE